MVYGKYIASIITKDNHTVLSIEDKITICEHLDNGSSRSEITHEYKLTVLSISCIFV